MIIGLSGFARSGKDTVANYLVSNYGFTKVSFADPMREALYRLDPKIEIADMHGVSLAVAVDGLGWEQLKEESPDVRPLMQRMGTEVGRNMFGQNFWVEQAMKLVAQHENVVLADVRFKNEADAILESDGVLWRVSRPGFEAVNAHISERDLDDYHFTSHITNDKTVESLHSTVDFAMHLLQERV
ncbi:hypothetical protein UFOVP46_60 [uncultured Caudovirales phage]|uniref:Deoxynucleoside monophosphate kinase n=1 Tax=uncultured Caudovirales phage TaxID=2100421 RepID=A0A6J5KMN2_9CAUD|nr:hypothetical protein UFOVP46_60 [uncultured Caudovirales phage]